ncbi:MAG: hypothetical protein WC269_03810, partial [Candidatus Gracilibacteria bacterium]
MSKNQDHINFTEGYYPLGRALKAERAKYGDHPDQRYSETQSSIDTYHNWFINVLEGKTIADLLTDKEKPVVVDLMSSTGALASLFEELPQQDKLGIAVSLGDSRTEEYKAEDKKLGIVQVVGDIVSSSTWRDIKKELQGRKADLIMERALGGWNHIPYSKLLYLTLLQRAWNILADGGTILLQPPDNKKTGVPLPVNELVSHMGSLGIDIKS